MSTSSVPVDETSEDLYQLAVKTIHKILVDEYDLTSVEADVAIANSFLQSVFDKDPKEAYCTPMEEYAKDIFEMYSEEMYPTSDEPTSDSDDEAAVVTSDEVRPVAEKAADVEFQLNRLKSVFILSYCACAVAVVLLLIGSLILNTRLVDLKQDVDNRFSEVEIAAATVAEPEVEEESDPVGQLTIDPADRLPLITADDIITLCSQFCTTEEMMYVRRGFNTHSYTMEIDTDLILTYRIENDDVKMRIYYHESGTYFSLGMLKVRGVDIVK